MAKKKDEKNTGVGFVTILEWMVDDLGLSGNALMIYAIIYGFSQGDRQEFTGTHKYLAHWTGLTVRNVIRNVNKLIEMGLLSKGEREHKGQVFPTYKAMIPDGFGVTKCHTPCDKMSYPPVTKCHTPYDKMSPHDNIRDNININNNIYNNPPYNPPLGDTPPAIVGNDKQEKQKKSTKFVPPTVDEVRAYCEERRNGIDAQRFVDYYASCGWLVSKGKKMADWQAAVRTWEGRDKERQKQFVKDAPRGSFDTDDFFEAALTRSYEDFIKSEKEIEI